MPVAFSAANNCKDPVPLTPILGTSRCLNTSESIYNRNAAHPVNAMLKRLVVRRQMI